MCIVLRREKAFSNRKDMVYARTFCYQYIPPPLEGTLYGRPLTFHMMFFPISYKYGYHKMYQLNRVFQPKRLPPPPKKKNLAAAALIYI